MGGGHSSSEGGGARLVEEAPGHALDHRLQRPTGTVGDHRATGGHRLQGRNSKILLAGEDKGAAASKELVAGRLIDPAEKLNVRPGHALQAGAVATVAKDLQGQAQVSKRLDDQLDPLVGNEPTTGQVEIPGGQRHRRRQHHRRRDDRRRAAIVATDATGHLA